MKTHTIKIIIKIILSILFFLCLLDMPYGYYMLVRIMAMMGFSILAYYMYKEERNIEMIVYICLAILFQPIFKIPLGRLLWNIVDVIVGLGLIVSIFLKKPKESYDK